jgi:hypothetical protein
MMLRVPPSPAAAAPSAKQPAPAASVAPASVRVAGAACRAAAKGKEVLSGVIFQPFEELKGELSLVPQKPDQSLARHKYVEPCEAAINEQIKSVLCPPYYSASRTLLECGSVGADSVFSLLVGLTANIWAT